MVLSIRGWGWASQFSVAPCSVLAWLTVFFLFSDSILELSEWAEECKPSHTLPTLLAWSGRITEVKLIDGNGRGDLYVSVLLASSLCSLWIHTAIMEHARITVSKCMICVAEKAIDNCSQSSAMN